MVKKFDSAPRVAGGDKLATLAPLPIQLPGSDRVYVATPPKRAIWQRAIMAARPNVPDDRAAAALVDFLRGCLADPQDGAHFEDRLLAAADRLDLPDLWPVVSYLTGDWQQQGTDEEYLAAQHAAYAEHLAAVTRPEPTADDADTPAAVRPGGEVIDGEATTVPTSTPASTPATVTVTAPARRTRKTAAS